MAGKHEFRPLAADTLTPLRRALRRSRWLRAWRRAFAAARLLGLRVRIPKDAWSLSLVNVVCCQVEVSAKGWSLVPGESYRVWCV